ncbi:hypothetical protein D3C78_1602040 [compost metagenome]
MLMQRVLGLVEHRLVLFQERPAVQRPLERAADKVGDPVPQQATDDPRRPGIIEVHLAAADQRADAGHHHRTGQQQPYQRQRFQKRDEHDHHQSESQRLGNQML